MSVNGSTPMHHVPLHRRRAGPPPAGSSGCKSWYCGLLPYVELSTLANALNFNYTQEWVSTGNLQGPQPGRLHGREGRRRDVPLPLRRCPQHLLRRQHAIRPVRQLQLRRQHRPPPQRPAPRRPDHHGGKLPAADRDHLDGQDVPGPGRLQLAAKAATTDTTVNLADITDGLSNTAAFSESLVNDGTGNAPRPPPEPVLHQRRAGREAQRPGAGRRPGCPGQPDHLGRRVGATTRGCPGPTPTPGRSTSTRT